jgi:hypothetical protein
LARYRASYHVAYSCVALNLVASAAMDDATVKSQVRLSRASHLQKGSAKCPLLIAIG